MQSSMVNLQPCRAQSLFLALGAPVLPGVNFQAHCQIFWRTVDSIAEKHVFEKPKGSGREWELGERQP